MVFDHELCTSRINPNRLEDDFCRTYKHFVEYRYRDGVTGDRPLILALPVVPVPVPKRITSTEANYRY